MTLKIFSCDQNSLRNRKPHFQDNNLQNMGGMDLIDKDKSMGDSNDTIDGIYFDSSIDDIINGIINQ
jgi:hypothetical protein